MKKNNIMNIANAIINTPEQIMEDKQMLYAFINEGKRIAEACKEEIKEQNVRNKELGIIVPEITFAMKQIPMALIKVDIADTEDIEKGYQRKPDDGRVYNISKDFNYNCLDVKSVNYRSSDGFFHMWDGGNSLAAMRAKGYTYMPCKVTIDLTPYEESYLFEKQNDLRRRVDTSEKFKASLFRNDSVAREIREVVVDEFGLTMDRKARGKGTNISSIRVLEALYKNCDGKDGVRFALSLIERANWRGKDKAYVENMLNIGYTAYPYCKVNPMLKHKIIDGMKEVKEPKNFIAKAYKTFTSQASNHNEVSVKNYTKFLLGLIDENGKPIN